MGRSSPAEMLTADTVRLFVESWTTSWTLVLGLGYIGGALAWPALRALGEDRVVRLMLLATGAVVLAMSLSGFPLAGLSVAGWAIGLTLIRHLVLSAD
jgi:hypothetical protein